MAWCNRHFCLILMVWGFVTIWTYVYNILYGLKTILKSKLGFKTILKKYWESMGFEPKTSPTTCSLIQLYQPLYQPHTLFYSPLHFVIKCHSIGSKRTMENIWEIRAHAGQWRHESQENSRNIVIAYVKEYSLWGIFEESWRFVG